MVSFWEGKVGDVGEGRCLFVITRGLYGCGFSMRVDLNEAAQGWEGTSTMKMFPAIFIRTPEVLPPIPRDPVYL